MPDGRGGFGSGNRSRIIRACEAHWDLHYDNCSGFVKAVAGELGISLTGTANDIFSQVQQSPWNKVGSGKHGAEIAGVMAAQDGVFVIAASKSSGHGHVAVITDLCHKWQKGKASNARPYGYWGTLGSSKVENKREAEFTTKKGTTVTFAPYNPLSRSWSSLAEVYFASHEL